MSGSGISSLRRGAASAALAALIAGGCGKPMSGAGGASPGGKYQADSAQSSLEVPPDLSRSGIRDAYEIPGASAAVPKSRGETSRVLPEVPDMRVERDGAGRRLVVAAAPEELWDPVREFWLSQGFLLDVDDPEVGVMETGWAEKRGTLPVGPVRQVIERFKRFAFTYGVRDRFRSRFERSADSGTTEIYITHRGAHEVVRGEGYAWTPRPSDPELEAEQLTRLMVFLGREEGAVAADASREAAPPPPQAMLVEDAQDGPFIALEHEFDRAWRLTQVALDRAGFDVEDRDRSQGWFVVRYRDPDGVEESEKGWLRKLAFWSRDREASAAGSEFQIRLQSAPDGATRIVVRDGKGERTGSSAAGRILTVLNEQLG